MGNLRFSNFSNKFLGDVLANRSTTKVMPSPWCCEPSRRCHAHGSEENAHHLPELNEKKKRQHPGNKNQVSGFRTQKQSS